MRTLSLVAAGVLLAATAGCQDPAFLSEEASCPGSSESCTADTQERLDAIARLDGVTGVERVHRSYGFDQGAFSAAVVTAEVATHEEATAVATAVLRELAAWPDHEPSTAEAIVRSDPEVVIDGTARDSEPMPDFYEPCPDRDCGSALDELRDRLASELDVSDLETRITGDRLVISGRAEGPEATYAARGALRVVHDLETRFADRVVVEFAYRGPLQVTLRLDGDLVCEQPPGGAVVSCDEQNSVSLGG